MVDVGGPSPLWAIPPLGQVILGSIKKKVAECEPESQPESSDPLWSLHQFLLWLPLMMELQVLRGNKPIPPQVDLVMVFTSATETQTRTCVRYSSRRHPRLDSLVCATCYD